MTTITLPEHLKGTHLLGGVEFAADGTAKVEHIGSHARRFLELTGATLSDDSAPAPDAPAVDAPPAKPTKSQPKE